MRGGRFRHYELRTTELNGARAFYAEVLGPEFWGADVSLIALPERAAARGAPPHWLGQIAISEHPAAAQPALAGIEAAAQQLVARGAQQLVARGAQQLGPVHRAHDGVELAVLRDPFGAVLALRPEVPSAQADTRVAWHELHTRDFEQAFTWYGAQFGWAPRERLDLGPELGAHQTFAWGGSGPSAGGISNGARLPHIHPQWLFCFRVADLDTALANARARGGRMLHPIQTAHGDLLAAGDDPQGAAFGLCQPARA
jgi:predicted enzyme related to lactoylglutathione lyase